MESQRKHNTEIMATMMRFEFSLNAPHVLRMYKRGHLKEREARYPLAKLTDMSTSIIVRRECPLGMP